MIYFLVRLSTPSEEAVAAPAFFEEMASAVRAAGDDIGADIRLEDLWVSGDDSSLYVLQSADTPPSPTLPTRLGRPVGLTPLRVYVDQPGEGAHLDPTDKILFGPDRQEVMGSIAPRVVICRICTADLTIEDHRRPPCPSRLR